MGSARRHAIAISIILFLGAASPACADGYSDLQGRELQPFVDEQALIGGLLRGLMNDKAATLDKVTVGEDSERRLVVHVSGKRLAGKEVRAEVLDGQKAVQREVPAARVTLPEADEGDLTLDLDAAAPEGTELRSAYLRLRVHKPGKSAAETERMFQLPKKWSRAISAENLVLKVVMQPEGAAARLREQPILVMPRLQTVRLATPVVAATAVAVTATLEQDSNRPGMDYTSFNLASADPRLCQQACEREARCQSFTYVKPGVQGSSARCWLKTGVPAARRDSCCVSGVKAKPAEGAAATTVRGAAVATLAARPLTLATARPAAAPPATTVIKPLAVSAKPMLEVSRFKFGLPAENLGKGARGPGALPIDLVSQIGFEAGQDPAEVMRIWPQVYQDRNPASGIFYFMPKAYHLLWDPAEGYGLRMLYGAAAGSDQAGAVVMAARLDAGVDSGDIAFVGDLLRAWQKRNPGSVFTELRRLPIDKPPEISLAGGLQQVYSIPADKIAINAISDALGQIDIQWATDSVTKENLQIALVEDIGINGSLTFSPAGGALPPQRIPVEIKLADRTTFGDIRWQRGAKWRNVTPYPLRLRYMHALLFENDLPIVYSWKLDDVTVPPRAQAEFDSARVPAWLDGKAKRMWLDYAVERDCAACDREVVAAITGGVSTLGAAPITFHTLTPLADLNAAEMSVMVRSRYFDPHSREVQTKGPLVLKADGEDFSIGPLYQDPQAEGALFEYQIELVMKDGTTYNGANWVAADRLRVVIGTSQIRQSIGRLPGE